MGNATVVYQVRDPRAIIASRLKHAQMLMTHGLAKEVRLLCSSMRHDYAVIQKLSQAFPHRVQVLRYEDVVQKPREEVERIYNFLRAPVHADVLHAFEKGRTRADMQQHRGVSESVFGTFRENPEQVATAWRSQLNVTVRRLFTKECRDVLQALLYD